MTFPKALVTRFFQLINNRQFAEAQRELQRLTAKMRETEWNHGYSRALHGMLLARKTNGNQYTFISNIDSTDRTAILDHKKSFLKRVQSRFNDDFDRGFFSAWTEYARLLIKTIDESQPEVDTQGQTSIIHYAEPTQKTA
ncbi:MAG: hypothetical protein NWE78_07160 [Candidatus Bathyarchaeota archaeon]|nr:hypothetical protein [Candidatus Bathyarchaeota archaeon]